MYTARTQIVYCCTVRAACSTRRPACGVRRAACGVRRAACGVRCAASRVRRAACGVWRVACGVRRAASCDPPCRRRPAMMARIFILLVLFCVGASMMETPTKTKAVHPWVLSALAHVAAAATVVVAKFVCKACRESYTNGRGLASHYRKETTHAPAAHAQRRNKSSPMTRKSYTFTRKRELIMAYDEKIFAGDRTDPCMEMHREFGIPVATIFDWLNDRVAIFLLAATPGMASKRKHVKEGPGAHPEAQTILYARFVWRRRYLRRRVNRRWLKKQFRQILRERYNVTDFVASNGWCSRYCRRWDITYQSRTNKHTDSILERIPLIRGFHQWLIYGLQRSAPQRCTKYGRFPPARMYHMDQVPCEFSPGTKKTLNMQKEMCAIKEPGGESSTKRMCTIQVTICADPDNQRVPIEIIFKNKSKGEHLDADELAYYETLGNIRVRFQGSAWADEALMMEYFRDFRTVTADQGEVLLGMDRHGSQKTPLCLAFMELTKIIPAFTPPNCTDCVSPVDHHIGMRLKAMMAEEYEKEYEKDEEAWHLPKRQGGLGDKKKRMLVARWASHAWQRLCTEGKHLIKDSFVATGFLLAKDGSENELVQLARGGQFDDYWF
jgi:hypothetical protein